MILNFRTLYFHCCYVSSLKCLFRFVFSMLNKFLNKQYLIFKKSCFKEPLYDNDLKIFLTHELSYEIYNIKSFSLPSYIRELSRIFYTNIHLHVIITCHNTLLKTAFVFYECLTIVHYYLLTSHNSLY